MSHIATDRRSSLLFIAALAISACTPEGSAPDEDAPESRITQPQLAGEISSGEIKVGLNYFSVWSWPYYNWQQAALDTYGRPDPWAGVRDFKGGGVPQNTQGWVKGDNLIRGENISSETYDRMWSQLEPYIGYYDLDQTAVTERQIRQAKAHGFHYFNFWWYWKSYPNDPARSQEVFNAAIHDGNCNDNVCGSFTRASNTNDMKFMISAIPDIGFDNLVTAIAIADEPRLFAIWREYFQLPNYLRTPDGRPIFNLFNTRGFTGTNGTRTLPDFIAALRQYMASYGITPFLLIDHSQGGNDQGDGWSCQAEWLDLAWQSGTQPGNYLDAKSQQVAMLESFGTSKPTLPCMFTDFHSLQQTQLQAPAGVVAWMNDWSRWAMRDAARDLRDSYLGPTNVPGNPLRGLVSVHAWNEWNEQLFSVEPSAANEDEIAGHLGFGFGLPARGRRACRVAGDPASDCEFDVLGTRWGLTEIGARTVTAERTDPLSNRFSDSTYTYDAGVIGETTLFFQRRTLSTGEVCEYYGHLTGADLDVIIGGATDCPGISSWNLTIMRERVVQRTAAPGDHGVRWAGYRGHPIEQGAFAFPAEPTGGPGMIALYNCVTSGADEFVSTDPGCEGTVPTSPSLIGYVWSSSAAGHTRAIRRCRVASDRFISGATSCEGQIAEGILGWADDMITVRRTANNTDHGVDFPGYHRQGVEGGATSFRVNALPQAGLVPLYNCLVSGGNEMVSRSSSCEGASAPPPMLIGYLWSSSGAGHTRVLYRCRVGFDHFISTSSTCEGQIVDAVLGYVP